MDIFQHLAGMLKPARYESICFLTKEFWRSFSRKRFLPDFCKSGYPCHNFDEDDIAELLDLDTKFVEENCVEKD